MRLELAEARVQMEVMDRSEGVVSRDVMLEVSVSDWEWEVDMVAAGGACRLL